MTRLKLKENDITTAQPQDIPQIAAMAMNSLRESEVPISVSYEKLLILITQVILSSGLCFVRRNKANPKLLDSFLLLDHRIPEYSTESVIYALLFYIKPEFRSFSLAKSLLNCLKNYAIIERVPIVFDLFTQRDVTRKKKLFTYLGFEEVGSLFFFRPPAKDTLSEEG